MTSSNSPEKASPTQVNPTHGTSEGIRLPVVLSKYGFDETVLLTEKQRKAAEYHILLGLPKAKARVRAGYIDYTTSETTESKDPKRLNYVKATELFKTPDMLTYLSYLQASRQNNIDLSTESILKRIGSILSVDISMTADPVTGKPLPPHELPEHVKKAIKDYDVIVKRLPDGTEETTYKYTLYDFNNTMRSSYGLMRDYEPQRFEPKVKQREVKLSR